MADINQEGAKRKAEAIIMLLDKYLDARMTAGIGNSNLAFRDMARNALILGLAAVLFPEAKPRE